MKNDIVGIGYPCQDVVIQLPHMPESGRAIPVDRFLYQGGGTVSTALVAASVLGASAGIIGVVGDDSAGRFCQKDFHFNGVSTEHLVFDPASSTAVNFCLSETERRQRSFLSYETAVRALRPEELDEAYIAQAKWLHLARMDEVSVCAAKIARRHGVRVMLDADMYDPRTQAFSGCIDALIASEEYYNGRFSSGTEEENCLRICQEGPSIVIITLGERGCVGVIDGAFCQAPAFQGNPVVDTTGAGDVFHGACLYGLLKGWTGRKLMRFANAVSAIQCTRLGGRTGIPNLDTVERFLESGTIDMEWLDRRELAYQNVSNLL